MNWPRLVILSILAGILIALGLALLPGAPKLECVWWA